MTSGMTTTSGTTIIMMMTMIINTRMTTIRTTIGNLNNIKDFFGSLHDKFGFED